MSEELNKPENNKENISDQNDLSKVKIRDILKQRFKKCGYKQIIITIILIVISFSGGIFTDRILLKHNNLNRLSNRNGIQRNMFNRNNKNKNRHPGAQNNNGTSSNSTSNQTQSGNSTQN